MTGYAAVAAALGLLCWPPATVADRLSAVTGREHSVRRPPSLRTVLVVVTPAIGVITGLGPAIATGVIAVLIIWRSRRQSAMAAEHETDDQLRQALTVVAAEMRAGAPMVHACRSAAAELSSGQDSPIACSLRSMAASLELGGRPDTAGDSDSSGLRRVTQAWIISQESGLPMVELLDSLRADLVARRDFRARTEAGLAGPRATAMVLAGLPVLGIGLGQLMGAAPLRVLLGSSVGSVLLVLGVCLATAGILWADAITQRVLR